MPAVQSDYKERSDPTPEQKQRDEYLEWAEQELERLKNSRIAMEQKSEEVRALIKKGDLADSPLAKLAFMAGATHTDHLSACYRILRIERDLVRAGVIPPPPPQEAPAAR